MRRRRRAVRSPVPPLAPNQRRAGVTRSVGVSVGPDAPLCPRAEAQRRWDAEGNALRSEARRLSAARRKTAGRNRALIRLCAGRRDDDHERRPLVQAEAITDLALQLVDWLPGSSPWGTYTFADAAAENGVAEFWAGGSKTPALTQLLELTYERRRDRFRPLVETIVRRGMSRRKQKGDPVQRGEIESLNDELLRLSFKIPQLVDTAFLDSLPAPKAEPAPEPAPAPRRDPRSAMPGLQDCFMALHAEPDRAKAGAPLSRCSTTYSMPGTWSRASTTE